MKISFANRIASFFPTLKADLRIAHMPYSPVQYVHNQLKLNAVYACLLTALVFFVLVKANITLWYLIFTFIILLVLAFEYSLIKIRAKIRAREKDIDREVLFVGRYLLVKLYSGRPLLNALIETANSRGIAVKYIREIVDDINTGSTIEDALNSAMIYSPSDKLRRILFHVNNALKLGIDVTKPLESVLEEITKEQELEIKKYGKKLNSLVIFYMLGAVIIPSLGVAMFIVISSFVNIVLNKLTLMLFIFFIIIIEFVFITLFKTIRPTVNL